LPVRLPLLPVSELTPDSLFPGLVVVSMLLHALIFCLYIASTATYAIEILPNPPVVTTKLRFNSPVLRHGVRSFTPITAPLKRAFPSSDGCGALDASLAGSIVLTKSWGCSLETKARHCGDVGCLGIVSKTSLSVAGLWAW
jgi:hypothetical protein